MMNPIFDFEENSNPNDESISNICLAFGSVLCGAKLFEITKKLYFYFTENPSLVKEFIWMLFCHGFLLFYALILLFYYPLLTQKFAWESWPNQEPISELQVYYWLQASFYTYLLLSEVAESKKANNTFMLHHIVTVTLLFLSYLCNITRFASQITFVHNISDVFLFAMKIINNTQSFEWAKPYFTLLFKLSWIITRLIILPFIITPTAVYEISIILNESFWWPMHFAQPYGLRILFFLYLSLLSIHIYWTILVFFKGLKKVTN